MKDYTKQEQEKNVFNYNISIYPANEFQKQFIEGCMNGFITAIEGFEQYHRKNIVNIQKTIK